MDIRNQLIVEVTKYCRNVLSYMTAFDCNVYTKITVPDIYGTHYSATRRWNAQADSFSYYDQPNQMTDYKVNGEADY